MVTAWCNGHNAHYKEPSHRTVMPLPQNMTSQPAKLEKYKLTDHCALCITLTLDSVLQVPAYQ